MKIAAFGVTVLALVAGCDQGPHFLGRRVRAIELRGSSRIERDSVFTRTARLIATQDVHAFLAGLELVPRKPIRLTASEGMIVYTDKDSLVCGVSDGTVYHLDAAGTSWYKVSPRFYERFTATLDNVGRDHARPIR